MHINSNMLTYRDVLLQSALRENTIEFRPKLPLCQDGEHDTLQHHGLRPLETNNRRRINCSAFQV